MPTEIVDGVYDITCKHDESYMGGARYRVFLFDGDVPTIIDAAFPDTTNRLIDGIEKTGVVPERLLITHGDGDHIGGYNALVDRYGVETWVPNNLSVSTRTEGVGLDTDPDHRFSDGERIGRFEAVHVPGHTEDSYAFVDERDGIAVMGDVAMGSDLRGFPPGYFVLPPEVWGGDVNSAERNLEKLLEYEFEVGLVYHGSSVLEDARDTLEAFVNFPGKVYYETVVRNR
ncbi:MBL fold metallo-hydrolase [Natrarchaeobius oligotrophus]|uniref:MBL fold metallo-hydrolase n=1 Tax=Natrarchaeobius chitinivorans TaxID=1679083 RepID=A0A3N6MGZ9_NATCH|nr:MBL fold metallo-hydrolase [Natrarchaeobius chitinivorans]RQH02338.1 MBL fold metallo-hydrolase [Natrarchaeobius chitinivorans]